MEDIERLHYKLVFLLDYDSRKCSKFVNNLLKRKKEWLFNFVMNPDVESTNNGAERTLIPSVIYRKISGGSRSEREELRSIRRYIPYIIQQSLGERTSSKILHQLSKEGLNPDDGIGTID